MKKRIAIQGINGAFHEVAAKKYFSDEEVDIIENDTFRDLFKCLEEKRADYGVMAIENSVAGTILPNYNLLRESGMTIIGEVYLRIEQNLLALPGQKIEDLTEVQSHPMAIMQCQAFFEQYPHIKLIESIDTAVSAKRIADQKLKGAGAISSELAAEIYGLEILNKSIETNKRNYTRFLIIQDEHKAKLDAKPATKSSICFTAAHEVGSLSKILSVLAFYSINLTKIQSLPILGQEWSYMFYIDLEFDDYVRYRQSLDAMRPLTSHVELLGEYPKGNKEI